MPEVVSGESVASGSTNAGSEKAIIGRAEGAKDKRERCFASCFKLFCSLAM
jgi:hypothetical protein